MTNGLAFPSPVRVSVGNFGKLFTSPAIIGWIDPIRIFVSGRVCCNLCAARVARTCRRFRGTFCFACSYWLDWSNQQLCFRSRLLQFVCGTCRVPVGGFGELFATLAPIGWIHPISGFVSGRGCCNLCAARVAYISFCFAWSYWSSQQLSFRSRMLQFVCGTCRVPVFLLSLAPIGWIDPISIFVSGRGCCNLCAARVAHLSAIWGNFALLAPIGWIDPISSFVSGRGCCNLCVARVAYLSFCFTCSYWLDWSNQKLSFRSRLLQFVCGTCREPVGGLGKLFASLVPIG